MTDKLIFPQRYLILVGLSGAGKSTLARELLKYTRAHLIEIGRFVVSAAANSTEHISPLEYANDIFKSKDYWHFVHFALNEAQHYKGFSIIVGPRLPAELSYLRTRLINVITVGLQVSDTVRAKRRLHQLSDLSEKELHRRDSVERSWGAEETISMCDAIVDGEQGLLEISQKVTNVWLKL